MPENAIDDPIKRWDFVHETLAGVLQDLLAIHNSEQCEGLRADTLLAIGYATGVVSRARALIERDIDDAKRATPPEEHVA